MRIECSINEHAKTYLSILKTDLLLHCGIASPSGMRISKLEEQLRQRDAQIKAQAARIKELEREIEELTKLLVEKAQSKEAKPPKEATNYSVDRHERKQRKNRRKKSTGRRPKEAKFQQATQDFDLYWHGADRKRCVLRREQFV